MSIAEHATREQLDSTANLVTLQVLNDVRSMMQQIHLYIGAQRAAESVREQWSRLADVVENISLCAFLLGTALCIQLFLNHSWY